MSNTLRAWVVVSGVALGAVYALSPLTLWFVVVVAGLFAAAGHGLPADERRTIVRILSIAVALRLLAVAVLFLATDHQQIVSFFWDGDGKYLKQRALWIRNFWIGAPVNPADVENAFNRAYGWTTYLYVIAYAQYLTGPAPYGIHLLNVAIFMATAILLYRIARQAYGSMAALLGLTILLFLPTPFMWSISALKESLYVLLEVCAMLAAITITRTLFRRKPLWVAIPAVVVLAAAVWANRYVREGALVISILALAAGFLASLITRRLSIAVLALVVLPFVAYGAVKTPSVRARVMTQLKASALQHVGHVHTEGNSYRLLDQRFYSTPSSVAATIDTMRWAEAARFTIRAVVAFVLVPLPWQIVSWREVLFLPQQIVWYFLVALGFFGFVAGLRRDAVVTCLLTGFAAAGGLAIALNSGNIGTMVRHRDTIVPFVVWLSALGAVDVMSRLVGFGARSAQHGSVIEARAACH
jgi:hypothetical protein